MDGSQMRVVEEEGVVTEAFEDFDEESSRTLLFSVEGADPKCKTLPKCTARTSCENP